MYVDGLLSMGGKCDGDQVRGERGRDWEDSDSPPSCEGFFDGQKYSYTMVGCVVCLWCRGGGEIELVVGKEGSKKSPGFMCIGIDVSFCESDDVWRVCLYDLLECWSCERGS